MPKHPIRHPLLLLFAIFILFQPKSLLAYSSTPQCDADDDSCFNDTLQTQMENWEAAVFGTEDMNLQSYVREVYQNVLLNIMETLGVSPGTLVDKLRNVNDGTDPSGNPPPNTEPPAETLNYKDLKTISRENGIIGLLSLANAAFYENPPASTKEYVAYIKDTTLIPQAEAQTGGATYTSLQRSIYLNLWRVTRNLSYALFVVVFILIGFAIMFRVKLSPQVALTLQNSIPRLIAALVLVTFSFAIAGFVMDLANVTGYLMGNMITNSIGTHAAGELKSGLDKGTGGLLGENNPGTVADYFGLDFPESMPGAPMILMAAVATYGIINIAIPILGGILGGLAAILVIIVMLILIIIFMVRIWLALLKAYIGFVLALIAGPLIILTGVLPGAPGFKGWLKMLVSNAMVFPTVFVMFLLTWIFANSSNEFATASWAPNFFGNSSINILGIPVWSLPLVFMSLGLFFLTPKAADIVKSIFDKKPFPYGTALTEALNQARDFGVPVGTAVGRAGFAAASADAEGMRGKTFVGALRQEGAKVVQDIGERKTGIRFRADPVVIERPPSEDTEERG